MECYVCCDDTDFFSTCQCVELRLCLNCLEKLRLFQYRTCTICKYPYPPPEGGYIDDIKLTKQEIDLILERFEREESVWHMLPVQCRPRRYREKRRLIVEIFFHVFCIYFLSCVASQVEQSNSSWYDVKNVYNVLIGCIVYLSVLGVANSICIGR